MRVEMGLLVAWLNTMDFARGLDLVARVHLVLHSFVMCHDMLTLFTPMFC